MNKIYVAGHLGADPETRFTPSGQKVTTFRIASNHRKGDKDVTTWWRITVWGDRFDKMMTYLKKGSAVMVWGELRAEIYIDKENRPQMSLDITADSINFSPFGKGTNSEKGEAPSSQQQAGGFGEQTYGQAASSNKYGSHAAVEEEPLPF